MTNRSTSFVALLRGINVSGRHTVPMERLRSALKRAGYDDVRTYIQSGNVVLGSGGSAQALEKQLEAVVETEFGFSVPIIVRPASGWRRYIESNPFPDEAREEGNRVLLALSKLPPGVDAAKALQQRATRGERVVRKGDAIWVHYADGIGRSKLTPAILDRCVGSPVTARNWRTVLKLDEMIREFSTP